MSSERAERDGSARRGAWYADPYEIADQRWWDGGKWTDAVREAPEGDAAAPHSTVTVRAPQSPESGEDPRTPDSGRGFPVKMEAAVGERLWLVPTDRRPSRRVRRELGLNRLTVAGGGSAAWLPELELVGGGGRVGSLSFAPTELARGS